MPETCFQDKQGYTPRLGQSYVSIPSFGPEDRAAKKQGLWKVLWQRWGRVGTVTCSFPEIRGRMIPKTAWSRDTSSRAECLALGGNTVLLTSFCDRSGSSSRLTVSVLGSRWCFPLHPFDKLFFCISHPHSVSVACHQELCMRQNIRH